MDPIATYVFFNLGTTGLLDTHPKITEIHMIAIKREDLRRYFREGGEEHSAELPANKKLHYRLENYEMCNRGDEIIAFVEDLKKPVCLIAHNGIRYHFLMLKAKLAEARGFSSKDVVCADAFAAFYDIMQPDALKTSYLERAKRSFPWPYYESERPSYQLIDVYERVWGCQPNLQDAEDRNNALIKIALKLGFEFLLWVAENNHPLDAISSECKEL